MPAISSSKPASSVSISRQTGDPVAQCLTWFAQADPRDLLLVEFSLSQWWLDQSPELELLAIYSKDGPSTFSCAVSAEVDLDPSDLARQGLRDWAAAQGVLVFSPGQVLQLQPAHIPKPWGQEIWFTGVEERGVCHFSDGNCSAPIPWVQALLPEAAGGPAGEPLVLLKILDPAPREVTGDLYFELHQEKREVYVVTHVDADAWPDGVGGIRYGFDPARVAAAGSEANFRQQYLDAVKAYEAVRREIDGLSEGDFPDESLRGKELDLRQRMNGFTYMRELRVGDVVIVPLLMPHSLQHGVRTIEFQTPVYERQILSFAQKVLTQDHWDTAAAVQHMRLTPPERDSFQALSAPDGVIAERIVDFPDFEVRRLTMKPGKTLKLEAQDCYQLLMVVQGQLPLSGVELDAEQAAFLPAGQDYQLASADPSEGLVLLLARPRG